MEDLDTSLSILRIMGPIMGGVGVITVFIMLWAPLVLYVLARWRANREVHADPQLGLKFALHYFGTLGSQILLAGVATFVFALSSADHGDKSDVYRASFALILAGGITVAAYFVLRTRTNDAHFPAVHRLYNGFQLMITGAVTFIALVVGCELVMMKGDTFGTGRAAATFLMVYGVATAWFVRRAAALSGASGPREPGGAYPPGGFVAPPQPQPLVVAAPGLPPLGGGAYPPIEPR